MFLNRTILDYGMFSLRPKRSEHTLCQNGHNICCANWAILDIFAPIAETPHASPRRQVATGARCSACRRVHNPPQYTGTDMEQYLIQSRNTAAQVRERLRGYIRHLLSLPVVFLFKRSRRWDQQKPVREQKTKRETRTQLLKTMVSNPPGNVYF